jgi:Protein of unknown function (DUF4236)
MASTNKCLAQNNKSRTGAKATKKAARQSRSATHENFTMGFRFRRRVGRGLFHLNISKSGLSLSTGVPGATYNVPLVNLTNRRRHPRATVGLPGTGLSYSHEFKGQRRNHRGVTIDLDDPDVQQLTIEPLRERFKDDPDTMIDIDVAATQAQTRSLDTAAYTRRGCGAEHGHGIRHPCADTITD